MKPGADQGSPLRVAPPVQSDTGQQSHPSRARVLHHDGRVMETAFLLGRGRGAGDLGGQGQGGLWLRQERAGGRGAVAGSRRLWWGGAGLAAFLAACAFFDVVVDVPVVQIVDVGFLDKVVTCPLLRMSCSSC